MSSNIEKIKANAITFTTDDTGWSDYTVKVRVGKRGDKVHVGSGYISADGKVAAPTPVCGTRGGLYGTGVAQAVTGREITCEKCPKH